MSGVFWLALSLSARMKPGVRAGLCSEDGKLAECGVGNGDGRGFVDVAAAIAFADAEALSVGTAGGALMTSAARMSVMCVEAQCSPL